MCWNRHGNIGGFFCVYLLLTLVAMLAVTSLVMQIYTWRLIADDGQGKLPYPGISGGRRGPGEPELARQIRANLAQFQIDNGAGPPIKTVLDHTVYSYTGDARVWTLGIPFPLQNNLAYYDHSTGQYGGYYADVTHEVCKVAGKNCRLTSESKSDIDECWTSGVDIGTRGGIGLHGKWFDACVGFSPSVIRHLVFDFSDSIVRQTIAYFYVLPGNPSNFDGSDLRGRRIGFPRGWYTDPDCVERNADKIKGAKLDLDQIIIMHRNELFEALQRGEIDAAFFPDELEGLAEQLEIASDRITTCTVDGDALMVRKDNKLPEWFDPAFRKVQGSREYREICKDIDEYYNTFLPGRSSEFICRQH